MAQAPDGHSCGWLGCRRSVLCGAILLQIAGHRCRAHDDVRLRTLAPEPSRGTQPEVFDPEDVGTDPMRSRLGFNPSVRSPSGSRESPVKVSGEANIEYHFELAGKLFRRDATSVGLKVRRRPSVVSGIGYTQESSQASVRSEPTQLIRRGRSGAGRAGSNPLSLSPATTAANRRSTAAPADRSVITTSP